MRVHIDQVRRHLDALRADGLPMWWVAEAIGVPTHQIHALNRPRAQTVDADLAARILATRSPIVRQIVPMSDAWRDRALCRIERIPTERFYPTRGEDTATIKAFCARCPVRAECLQDADAHEIHPNGIWGGLSERQRRQRRRELGERAS